MDQRQGPGPADRNPLGDKGPAQGPGNDNDKKSFLSNFIPDTKSLALSGLLGVASPTSALAMSPFFGLAKLAQLAGLDVQPGPTGDMSDASKAYKPTFNQPAEPSFSYNDPLLMERYQAYLQAGYPPELADYLVNTLT
jgi:hypothetical protein